MAGTVDPIQPLLTDLDKELLTLQPAVLKKVGEISGAPVTVGSFHGTIGSKNNLYVDAVREEFDNPNDFYAAWLKGLRLKIVEDSEKVEKWQNEFDRASIRLGRLLTDSGVEAYTRLFLERSFYRHYHERTRFKPDDELWSIWFGDNAQPWGLLIAPAFRFGQWTNDKSEMRRAKFEYWTVGHVLSTGLVVPDRTSVLEFSEFKNLRQFYDTVLKRASKSQYEQQIVDRYLAYLDLSPDVINEPLLIPEIRYAGKVTKHEYRLDFSVLNSHTRQFTGFELSPASTHMNIDSVLIKDFTKKAANEKLSKEWEDEMEKRNAYFDRFGITTVTFTDSRLKNLDDCFVHIDQRLKARPPNKSTADSELASIRNMV